MVPILLPIMRPALARLLRAAGTVLLLAGAMSAHAAFDAFLKIEGVDGESTDSTHTAWIEIDSFQSGMVVISNQPPAQFSPLLLRKRIDKSSPLLAKACASGQHIAQVKLNLVRTTPKRVRFYQVSMQDVLVSSMSASGTTGDSALPEAVEFLATSWSWSYTEFENDGRPLQDLSFQWDLAQNAGDLTVTPAMRASGAQSRDGQFTLSFPAKPGIGYRILGAADLAGDFTEVQQLEPAINGGDVVVTLPPFGQHRFFIVEELP
jgi:type VI secretion system secreted protein Hcp